MVFFYSLCLCHWTWMCVFFSRIIIDVLLNGGSPQVFLHRKICMSFTSFFHCKHVPSFAVVSISAPVFGASWFHKLNTKSLRRTPFFYTIASKVNVIRGLFAVLFAGAPTWKGATCHSKNGSVSIKSIQTSKQPAANAPGYMFCIYNKEHILVPVWCLGRILLCLLFISKSILRLFEMAQFCVFLCCGSTI